MVRSRGKWGFINQRGLYVIEPKFDWAWNFNEGIAAVSVDSKWGFIDKEGNYIVEPKFDAVHDYNYGMVAVEINGKWGFLDKSGKNVIKPEFNVVSSFEKCASLDPVITNDPEDLVESING